MTARGPATRAGLLFDLDGTLAQTEHLHHAAFNALLAAYGRSLDHPTFLRHVSGRSNEDITAYLFPDLGSAERERLAQDKERWFRELAAAGVDATPGAVELLAWARGKGIATGLVTNAPRENAELMVAVMGFTRDFDVIVSAAELPRSKPFPDPYLAALRALSLDPARTLAVEDSAPGIAAARAASLDVIALATAATAASIAASGAALTVADMTDERVYALASARLLL
ncbi:MAG: HAD-IA family hydrolase [Burkholderiales bacterium]|nr:HAD-IA family hydrolase [Burkholderiales bacterium]